MAAPRSPAELLLLFPAALTAALTALLVVQHDARAGEAAVVAAANLVCGLWLRRTLSSRADAGSSVERPADTATVQPEAASHSEGPALAGAVSRVPRTEHLDSVGRLAGGLAHDFNNVLTVIGASASMAERALEAGGPAIDDLRDIHRAVGRAADLTKQLLTFARQQALVKRAVDLNELVSSVERTLKRVLGQATRLSSELCREPLRVQCDPAQLEQVLVNLVLNARDAVGDAGRITLSTRRAGLADEARREAQGLASGDYACIEVQDDGCGMSSEVKGRLFEPFFSTKPPGKGTGLGLAICYGIVRQHDGSIDAESEPGRGSTLRVLLPLSNAELVPTTSGVVPVASTRPRVLVAEDEPQVRAIAARALSGAGMDVKQAANGAIALELIQRQSPPFDLLVTDVVMPELSGPELARAARRLQPRLGLVFMSGFPEAMHSASAAEFDGAAFLPKPFSPQTLVEAARESLPDDEERVLQSEQA